MLPWQQHADRWGAGLEVAGRGARALEKPKVSLQAVVLIRQIYGHIQLIWAKLDIEPKVNVRNHLINVLYRLTSIAKEVITGGMSSSNKNNGCNITSCYLDLALCQLWSVQFQSN